jgi:hypothetical protein
LDCGVKAVLMIVKMVEIVGFGELQHTMSSFTDSLEAE